MAPAQLNPEPKRDGEAAYRITRDAVVQGRRPYHAATVSYFEERRRRLAVVATTQTTTGQTLDWVAKGDIASPPEAGASPRPRRRRPGRARFELQDDKGARGPAGTVPVLRKDLSAISVDQPLSRYLAKRPPGFASFAGGGLHHYAFSGQRAYNYGADGSISVVAPYTETSADFSLLQMAVTNDEEGAVQTVEAGIQVMQGMYGDWSPHLFVYYTTNGYAGAGDYQGGYNLDVAGWVQVDGTIFPGGAFSAASAPGGDQFDLFFKYQLSDGNWWLMVADRWVGYYPAGLFAGNRSPGSSLADHGTTVAFHGEVFDSDAVDGLTSTDMGSGQWADAQWPWAAYQRNLRVQVDSGGGMVDYNPDGVAVSSPSMYGLETHILAEDGWGSYQYVGGPGAG
jgi:hypothetical protein